MRISKKKHPLDANLVMYDSSLDIVSEFNDLSLLGSHNLSWNSYVNRIVYSANRMLGLISRTYKGLFDVPTLKTLYCSLMRSQLEYSSIVRSPHTRRNIDLIERVQKRATKLILKSDSNYESPLKEINLVSLEQRRFIADVTFLYKFKWLF